MTKGGLVLNGASIIVIVFCMFFYNKSTEKKIAYVKIQKLYDEFQMKKDLETKFKTTEKVRKNLMDNLAVDRNLIKRLNTYAQNYGTEHNYTYILGSDESGIIMQADQKLDITNEVLTYINSK